MSTIERKSTAGRFFWAALIVGCALSAILAFAAQSDDYFRLILPQAGGWFVATLLLGWESGSEALFLFVMIAVNAVAYTGIIFIALVALFRPAAK